MTQRVKLLHDIIQNGHVKSTRRKNPKWEPPKAVKGKLVESKEPEFLWTFFTQGAVVELSNASAQKFIENGWAEVAK